MIAAGASGGLKINKKEYKGERDIEQQSAGAAQRQ